MNPGYIENTQVKKLDKAEVVKWGWLALAVTLFSIIIISLPWIPGRFKIALAVPLYAAIVFVNYKYICLKKETRQEGIPVGGAPERRTPGKNESIKKGKRPGKASHKKGR